MAKRLPIDPKLVDVTQAVAAELDETLPKSIHSINRAIQVIGIERITKLVAGAKAAHGTMLVSDNTRPRTLGGCFFYLLRKSLGHSKFRKIQKWHYSGPTPEPGAQAQVLDETF